MPTFESFKWTPGMSTLLLLSLPSKRVVAHATFVRGNSEQEAKARAALETTRDRWQSNAPQYCRGGFEIHEVQRPRVDRVASARRPANQEPDNEPRAMDETERHTSAC